MDNDYENQPTPPTYDPIPTHPKKGNTPLCSVYGAKYSTRITS